MLQSTFYLETDPLLHPVGVADKIEEIEDSSDEDDDDDDLPGLV